MWEAVAAIIFLGGLLFWLRSRRGGQMAFWNLALKHPDVTYDFFQSSGVWHVFDEGLPADFRDYVPAGEWIGPFPMYVPKLGNRKVFVFGKKSEFRQSQEALVRSLRES